MIKYIKYEVICNQGTIEKLKNYDNQRLSTIEKICKHFGL